MLMRIVNSNSNNNSKSNDNGNTDNSHNRTKIIFVIMIMMIFVLPTTLIIVVIVRGGPLRLKPAMGPCRALWVGLRTQLYSEAPRLSTVIN